MCLTSKNPEGGLNVVNMRIEHQKEGLRISDINYRKLEQLISCLEDLSKVNKEIESLLELLSGVKSKIDDVDVGDWYGDFLVLAVYNPVIDVIFVDNDNLTQWADALSKAKEHVTPEQHSELFELETAIRGLIAPYEVSPNE